MCGDAGDPEHVAELFGDKKPDLVFTSPPYDKQRDYKNKIDCWQTLMQRVFGVMPHHERTQVLVNLGLVHRKGEWVPYWEPWIEWMRGEGWRRFGLYVWDKGHGFPMDPRIGRPNASFELLLHFHKYKRHINKTVACVAAGSKRGAQTGFRRADGKSATWSHSDRPVQPFKSSDDVWRIGRGPTRSVGHPAVFPVALPLAIHAAYTNLGDLVYDPFVGSGTSILAAEQGQRVCYAMEIAPEYCQIAINRWEKHQAKGAA